MMAPFPLGAEGLTLAKAYDLSLSASEAIQLKELALAKSRLAVQEASSRLWPRVDLQASASYLANPPQGYTVKAGELGNMTLAIPPNKLYPGSPAVPLGSFTIPPNDFTIGSQQHDYFSLSATLSQPLFTWGKIRNAIDLASLGTEAATGALAAQRKDIQREVHRAYFTAMVASRSLSALKLIREAAAGIAADRRTSFDDGTSTREPVLEAEANLAALDAKLVNASQSLATSLEALGMLTGLDPGSIVLATDFTEKMPALDEQELRAKALRDSTDLAAARTTADQARKKLAIEQGGAMLLPDISLGITANVTGQQDLPYAAWSWDPAAWSWDVVVSLGVKASVFDGAASWRRIDQAGKDVEMAGAAARQQEKLVGLAVRRAVDAALRAEADVVSKKAGASHAAERLRNARGSFDDGLISRQELRGAEILAGSAELDLLFAQWNREEALADLEHLQ
jgi:outer membrane protein TolC